MKYTFVLILVLLAGCFPASDTLEPLDPEAQGDLLEQPEENAEITIVERLLPSGFIEVGDREAPVALLLFTEHHCRYCKQFYREQFPQLHEEFIDQGKVRLQIGILPLKKYIHSEQAAKGLLCAATQGKGIAMHELLFALGAKDRNTLKSQAITLELDLELFNACLDSPDTQRTVDRQKSLARSFDVELVPTFFLNGQKSVGLPHYPDLRGMIEEAIENS